MGRGGNEKKLFLLLIGKTLQSFTLLNRLCAMGARRKHSLSDGTHLSYFIKQPALRCKQQD